MLPHRAGGGGLGLPAGLCVGHVPTWADSVPGLLGIDAARGSWFDSLEDCTGCNPCLKHREKKNQGWSWFGCQAGRAGDEPQRRVQKDWPDKGSQTRGAVAKQVCQRSRTRRCGDGIWGAIEVEDRSETIDSLLGGRVKTTGREGFGAALRYGAPPVASA